MIPPISPRKIRPPHTWESENGFEAEGKKASNPQNGSATTAIQRVKLGTKCPLGNTYPKRTRQRKPSTLSTWAGNHQGEGSRLIKPSLNTSGKRARETAARSARRSPDLRQKSKAATSQYPTADRLTIL